MTPASLLTLGALAGAASPGVQAADDPDGNAIVFASTDPARHAVDPWRRQPGSG